MARIETYGRDTVVTGLDKVIGTDRESGKATKNYEMSAIRDFVLEGASPEVGGQLKITSVIQDTPIPSTESPEVLLNNLDPVIEISKYEILIVRLSFNDSNNEGKLTKNVYLFNKVDVIVGFEEYDSTINDFILLSSDVEASEVIPTEPTTVSSVDLNVETTNSNVAIDTDGLIESTGSGEVLYKGYESNKHKFKSIKSTDGSVDVDTDNESINLKVTIPEDIQRDFYFTGDGQTNPISFSTGFDGGTVCSVKTLIKDTGTTYYSRIEVKGEISIPSTLDTSLEIMSLPSNYIPVNLVNPLNTSTRFLIGDLLILKSGGDRIEAKLSTNNQGSVKIEYLKQFSDLSNVTADIDPTTILSQVNNYGSISLDYFSREVYA